MEMVSKKFELSANTMNQSSLYKMYSYIVTFTIDIKCKGAQQVREADVLQDQSASLNE